MTGYSPQRHSTPFARELVWKLVTRAQALTMLIAGHRRRRRRPEVGDVLSGCSGFALGEYP
jgi:hypothetical protein